MKCRTCHENKPETDFRVSRGKPRTQCRRCEASYRRDYYCANPERERQKAREAYYANKEKAAERIKKWRIDNRDRMLAQSRVYHEKNKEKRNAQSRDIKRAKPPGYSRAWPSHQKPKPLSETGKEKRRTAIRNWSKRNQDRRSDIQAERRARKAATTVRAVSRADVIARDGLACYLCGKGLIRAQVTLDHVVPLSNGGTHTIDNLRVCCRACNCSKGTRDLSEYLAYKAARQHS